jgi:hypothetical protein
MKCKLEEDCTEQSIYIIMQIRLYYDIHMDEKMFCSTSFSEPQTLNFSRTCEMVYAIQKEDNLRVLTQTSFIIDVSESELCKDVWWKVSNVELIYNLLNGVWNIHVPMYTNVYCGPMTLKIRIN